MRSLKEVILDGQYSLAAHRLLYGVVTVLAQSASTRKPSPLMERLDVPAAGTDPAGGGARGPKA